MKKISLALPLFCLIINSGNAMAKENIFAPKTKGISESEFNEKLNTELMEQRRTLESSFDAKIYDLKTRMEDIQNAKLKEIMDELKKSNQNKTTNNNYQETTNLNNKNKEIESLLKNTNEKQMLKDSEILNNEFGDVGLKFISITNNKKLYKNSDGEYIIKDMDFDFAEYKRQHRNDENQRRIAE